MSAGLFSDPDNPSEEELLSNPKVAVAPVAAQYEWIDNIIQQPESDMVEESNDTKTWWIAGVLGVIALIGAGALLFKRR